MYKTPKCRSPQFGLWVIEGQTRMLCDDLFSDSTGVIIRTDKIRIVCMIFRQTEHSVKNTRLRLCEIHKRLHDTCDPTPVPWRISLHV